MFFRSSAVVAAIGLFSSVAVAQDAAPPVETAPVKEKKICRSLMPTGSIMAKRTCMTRAEWAKFNASFEKQNQAFRDQQSRGGTNPN